MALRIRELSRNCRPLGLLPLTSGLAEQAKVDPVFRSIMAQWQQEIQIGPLTGEVARFGARFGSSVCRAGESGKPVIFDPARLYARL